MEYLQVSQIESLEKVKVVSPIAGLSKADVKVKSDSTTNELFITTSTPKNMDKDVAKKFTFDKTATVALDDKYDVTAAKVSVNNGILLIIVPVRADRIKTIEID